MEQSTWKSIPGFAKMLIFLQTVVILFLSFWIWQEYQKNPYLQAYINNVLQGNGLTVIAAGAVGLFSFLSVLLFSRLHRTERELEAILHVENVTADQVRGSGFLDHRTEQHLIDMIRHSSAVEQAPGHPAPANGRLPVLKTEEPSKRPEDEGAS